MKRLRNRRRRRWIVASIVIIILCLLLFPWQCQPVPAAGDQVSPLGPKARHPQEHRLGASAIGRPVFAHDQKHQVSWGAELDAQLARYEAAVRTCLQTSQSQFVSWSFHFNAAQGLIRHKAFADAEGLPVQQQLTDCLSGALPAEVMLHGNYPNAWINVNLKLIDRIGE